MPQEAWVLKCYSCEKFQVQLKKKAKKWQCKVCGAKQDLMTIFFKGQPSDCRINVQNMNAGEGEKLEKVSLTTQSDNHNEHYYDECKNPGDNYFQYDDEEFNENSVKELDEQCKELEEKYSQETSTLKNHFVEDNQNISQEFTKITETQSCITDGQKFSDEENIFEVHSTDFKIETFNNKLSNSINNHNVPKSSIFESNNEFNESLDF